MVIKTFQGGFLAYCLGAISSFDRSDLKDKIIGSLIFVSLVGLIIANFVFLHNKTGEELQNKDFKSKFSAIYGELNVQSKWALVHPTLFYLVRMAAATLIITAPFTI